MGRYTLWHRNITTCDFTTSWHRFPSHVCWLKVWNINRLEMSRICLMFLIYTLPSSDQRYQMCFFPSGNQTWHWKLQHFSISFPLKPPSMFDFQRVCLMCQGSMMSITRGYMVSFCCASGDPTCPTEVLHFLFKSGVFLAAAYVADICHGSHGWLSKMMHWGSCHVHSLPEINI